MRKTFTAIFLLIILFGCEGLLQPSEKKVTKRIEISKMPIRIDIKSMFDIVLHQNDSIYAVVTCNSSYVNDVDIHAKDDTLYLEHSVSMRWLHGYDIIKLDLYLPYLPIIHVKAPVSIKTKEKFYTKMLNISDWEYYSNCDIDVQTTYVVIQSSGSSYSSFHITGSADSAFVYSRGSSVIDLSELQVNSCTIHHKSIADARLNVSTLLRAEILSSGKVYYKGNPTVVMLSGDRNMVVKEE